MKTYGSYASITADLEDGILTITLNRPDRRNAINQDMVTELMEILDRGESDFEIKGILLTGAGSAFCAGADLEYLKSLLDRSFADHLADSRRLKDLYYKFYSFPKPTLAMVNGPAMAGGCGLMNVCDYALASEKAVFGYPEVKVGFVAAIVSTFLIASVGERKTRRLLLSGDTLDAKEALAMGLVNKTVTPSKLHSSGRAIILRLIKNSPASIKATKSLIETMCHRDLESNLERACEMNARSRLHADFKEGILSFLEKRKPVWS